MTPRGRKLGKWGLHAQDTAELYRPVTAEAAVRWTVAHPREREVFRRRLVDFQNTRFRPAELTTEVEVTRGHPEEIIGRDPAGPKPGGDA